MIPNKETPIFIISHEFPPTRGGVATFTYEMARALAQLGYSVEVWAPQSGNADDTALPFAVKRLKLRGSRDLACQVRLIQTWIAHRAELRDAMVYLTDSGPILAMRFLQFFAPLRPRQLLLAFHGSEINHFIANPIRKWLIAKVIKRSDRLNTLSKFTAKSLVRAFPDAAKKIRLTPGALRSDFNTQTPLPRSSTDRVTILVVGRLHPRKGQDRLIAALETLPEELRDRTQLWIAGSGNKFGYGDSLKESARNSNTRIEFFGNVSDSKLDELYHQADVFALTSVPFRKSVEGFGLVYLEAAAYGLPVVAHRIGGTPEAVDNGENGLLVDPDDPAGLTDALARLIQNDTLRAEMGRKSIEWSRKHSWTDSANALLGPPMTKFGS